MMARARKNRDGARLRVLVVDDVPVSRVILRRIIERFAFVCVEAEGFADARQAMERTAVQAIVIDSDLPNGEFHRVVRLAREHSATRCIAVIAVSAKPMNEAARARVGVDAVVQRPTTVSSFAAALALAFANQTRAGETVESGR